VSGAFTGVGGRLLAELGAEVILVEPPAGAPERARPPFAGDRPHPERSLRWWSTSVGKSSVIVDLGTDEGIAQLSGLLSGADVLIEGLGLEMDRLGLAFEHVSRLHPSLIWVSVTPFGRHSDRAGDPVTDLTMLAGSGPVWNCGYDDHTIPPIRGAGDQANNIAGSYAAIGALVALADRDRSGLGQLVDVNVNAACNVTSEQTTYNWLVSQLTCTRQTGRHAYHTPTGPVQVRCADGVYATTGVLPRHPSEFRELHGWLEELHLLDRLPEAVFLEMAASRDTPMDLAAIGEDDETTAVLDAARSAISLVAAHLPAKEFFLQSQRKGFAAGAVLSPDEAFDDEHVAARGFRVPVEHPELGATYDYPGVPYIFSATPAAPPRRPPLVGEHNADLLGDPPS
jgi:crotonobetainyl-CoA:carnitine CoA-transferase CaiB-like acyl-CoA transferase